jgi:signal transduction histidine kinase
MKLTTTLYAFVVAGLLVVLGSFGLFSYRREIEQFENDIRLDARVLGGAIASAAVDVWNAIGEERAREIVTQANAGESLFGVRWVRPDARTGDADRPLVRSDELSPLRRGRVVVLRASRPDGARGLCTYVPLRGPSGELAALELFESFDGLNAYTRDSAKNLVLAAAVLVLAGASVMAVVGYRLVGRRMLSLVRHARLVGGGDLGSRVHTQGRDEIAELGTAMNQMAAHLEESRRKLLEETRSRLEALEQLRHAERVATLGQLSAGMAHELGTPLNVIFAHAKLVSGGRMDREEVADSSRIISEQAERVTAILRQFLEYGRRSPVRRSAEDLGLLVTNVLALLAPMARKRRISFDYSAQGDASLVTVDRSQIQQVCMNLIRNGIQAMPEGGRLEVGVATERACPPSSDSERTCAVIHVRDEGVGIPEPDRARIFEPFFSTKSAGEGTGLGLAIVAGIVQDHGGWITVDSTPGEGSCFRVYLPSEECE